MVEPPPVGPGDRVAVVGAGVSGLTAAYLLATRAAAQVTVFEADDRLGGHTHTHTFEDASGRRQRVDSGFIVHNDRTYPLLLRLFDELGVATRDAEMSMSIRVEPTGIEYAGGRGLGGILARPAQLLDRRFALMLTEIRRFHRAAHGHLRRTDGSDLVTLGQFLQRHRFSEHLRDWYARPLVACVWSTGTDTALSYPARYLFRFLDNHGMLSVSGSPQWRTIVGGSATYVDRLAAHVHAARVGRPVVHVRRPVDGPVVLVTSDGARHEADRVVLAGHADQMLDVLDDATTEEKEVLGAFRYSRNHALVHRDLRLLPRAPRARASWNYVVDGAGTDEPPVVTYWMNRLQGLRSTDDYLVSLNAADRVDETLVLAEADYTHPVYDATSVAAQPRLPGLTSARTAFAGAYHGWGFHEDGCRSGAEVARAWGVRW